MRYGPPTLYFANLLLGEADLEPGVRALTRQPWFQVGAMPDWLRDDLVKSLEPNQEAPTRAGLERLLLTSLEHPAESLDLEIEVRAPAPEGWRSRFMRSLLEQGPPTSPLRDYVLLSFLKRGALGRLMVAVPVLLGRLLLRERRRPAAAARATPGTSSQYPRPIRTAMYLAGAFAGSALAGTLGFMAIDRWPAFDAFYMTISVLTKCVYGEIHPLSFAGGYGTPSCWFGARFCCSAFVAVSESRAKWRAQVMREAMGVDASMRQIQQFSYFGLAASLCLIAGTLGFVGFESWPPLDAFYMAVTVLTRTAGMEVHPLSTTGRSFNAGFMVATYCVLLCGLAIVLRSAGIAWRDWKSRSESRWEPPVSRPWGISL